MTQTHIKETFQVPRYYQFCFLAECPLSKDCIRYFAGEHIDRDALSGFATFPAALKDSKCRFFKKTRLMHGAWGFNTLFENVKLKDSAQLHHIITKYLGGRGTYYRYHYGEKLLTPEQQKWIIDLFKQYHYTDNLQFDGYKDVYDW